MFADPDFAAFSQEIGLASLGASDDDIKKLAACYWHSVEFGLLEQDGELKAYGAGLLSSFGEIVHACNSNSTLRFDPIVSATTEFPITEYQPIYFVASSLRESKDAMRKYCEEISRPFYARYNELTSSIWVDRAVKTSRSSTIYS